MLSENVADIASQNIIDDIIIPTIDLGFDKPREKTRVVVAMSGGVDSSVCAALVHNSGYETIGITLQLYDHGAAIKKKNACCAGQDIYDAKNIADQLGFPHYTLDYESRFKEQVIEDFADTYMQGATPIPCVRCNQSVKFKDLLELARSLGADCMVTGHYVARLDGDKSKMPKSMMHRAKDRARDQSYFLFATTQKQLDFLRFPLADIEKDDVRKIAKKLGLNVAAKPDSQDICFVPEGKYQDIVLNLRPLAGRAGEVVHIDGRVLGTHNGVINFTIGQRRGLGIATGDPIYVVAIDAKNARVIVGPKEALAVKSLTLKEINWLGDKDLNGQEVLVRVRSTRPPVLGKIRIDNDVWNVDFVKPEEGVAPGQACVFYEPNTEIGELGERVLGGGFIEKTVKVWEE